MFKRIPYNPSADIVTNDTFGLPVWVDRLTMATNGHRILVGENLYESPTDFTIALSARGVPTITWLSADTIQDTDEVLIGIAIIDSVINGDVTGGGGGGGGGDVNLIQIGGTTVAKGSGAITAGTLRAVLATDQPAVPTSSTTVGAGSDLVGANTVMGQLKEANATLAEAVTTLPPFEVTPDNRTRTAVNIAGADTDTILTADSDERHVITGLALNFSAAANITFANAEGAITIPVAAGESWIWDDNPNGYFATAVNTAWTIGKSADCTIRGVIYSKKAPAA